MSTSTGKENILKRIRKALTHSTPLPFPGSEGNSSVFLPSQKELEVEFAEKFTALQGRFSFCLNLPELGLMLLHLMDQKKWTRIYCKEPALRQLMEEAGFSPGSHWEENLMEAEVSITSCEFLVARTGSMVLSSASASGRTPSVFAPVHICLAFTDQLVYSVRNALDELKKKYGENLPSQISLASGPSRTADIEKTLVVGVHGPKEVFVFLLDR